MTELFVLGSELGLGLVRVRARTVKGSAGDSSRERGSLGGKVRP